MGRLVLVGVILAATIIGCGSEPAPAPSATEQEAIKNSTSAWNKESLDAFNKAHERAKSGADEDRPAGGTGKGK